MSFDVHCLRTGLFDSSIYRGDYFEYKLVRGEYVPEVKPRVWDVYEFNYDNVAKAMLTLFAVQTGEGWPEYVSISFEVRLKFHS